MKYLKVDEQTLSDLSILGKQGKASVYALFNRTRTQGGAALLNELFKLPLADETEINRRAGIYQFFSQQEFEFPVESEVIGMLNHYLKNDDVRTQIQLGKQHIGQRFRDMVATDAEVNFINDGVQAALRLFSKLLAFLEKWKTIAVKGPGEQIFGQLEKLIQDNAFTPLHPYTKNAREARLSHIQLSELDKLIRFEEREKMLELLQLLFELDVFIAVGKVTRAQGFHFAKAMPSGTGTLHYQQVYHPHVEGAIANDLHLNASQNILFLTGANMAGKSTLMKSIGIALYLAHMGFPVAAKQFEFSVRDGIYTSINLSDNLSMGASHYYAEVLRVKEVAVELSMGKQLFVILDELF
ncbi:MAG: DNA mismatch repair protein, partial [Chitinophagaceae bacterium]|nr:DNA mismatch repair protein [Chitinophagaceae bacterium]